MALKVNLSPSTGWSFQPKITKKAKSKVAKAAQKAFGGSVQPLTLSREMKANTTFGAPKAKKK